VFKHIFFCTLRSVAGPVLLPQLKKKSENFLYKESEKMREFRYSVLNIGIFVVKKTFFFDKIEYSKVTLLKKTLIGKFLYRIENLRAS